MLRNIAKNEEYDPGQYLKNVSDRFIFINGIYVPKSCKEKSKGRKFQSLFLKIAPIVLNALTLFFIIKYTNYARLQWIEMKRTAKESVIAANAANDAVTQAKVANKQAADADRPWFGIILASVEGFEVGKIPVATVLFVNSGRRPAKVILSEVGTHWYKNFPEKPVYQTASRSVSIAVPNSQIISKFNVAKIPLSQLEIDAAAAGVPARYFIYANVQYIDIGTGQKHHTRACWSYIGNDPVLAKSFYSCSEYQDAD